MPDFHRLRPALLACLGLLSLAACDRGPATVTHYRHTAGTFDFLISATRNGGPLLLQVEGQAFEGGGDVVPQMTQVLQQALQSRELRLTTDPGAAEDPRFRLVIVFNPAAPGDALDFCEGPAAGGSPETVGRVDLRAGFCRDGKALAVIDGWAKELEGLEDERFAQLLRQVSRDVFSREGGDD